MEKTAEPDKRERYMNLIGQAVRRAVKGECVIIFFGSVLTDRFSRTSDIDVAIFCKSKLTARDLIRIEEEFEKLPILRDIDLVDIRSVKSSNLLQDILEGKVWKSSPELMKDLRELCKSIER